MRELVFFLEEESAKALLTGLLPRLLPTDRPIETRFIAEHNEGGAPIAGR